MPVKVAIQMASRADGDALKRSLEDPTVRAITVVCGVLLELPMEQRQMVLSVVTATVASPIHRTPRTPIENLPAMRLGLDDAPTPAHVARSTGE